MALFSRTKKENTSAPEKPEIASTTPTSFSGFGSAAHVLHNPRITEKATLAGGGSAYLFDVAPNATKRAIAEAFRSVYKISPQKVRVVTIPAKLKRSSRTGRIGVKQGGKKAYVFLKKGETITIA